MPVGALNSRRLLDRSVSLHQTVDTNSPSNEHIELLFTLSYPSITRTKVTRMEEIGRRGWTPLTDINIYCLNTKLERPASSVASSNYIVLLRVCKATCKSSLLYSVYRTGTQACLKKNMLPISTALAS